MIHWLLLVYIHIETHVGTSEELLMICENIWSAASPTDKEPCVYAGTSCPLGLTSNISTHVPARFKSLNSRSEDADVRERARILEHASHLSVDGVVREHLLLVLCSELRVERIHHRLDAVEVEDVIRISVIDNCAHACIDDRLQIRA